MVCQKNDDMSFAVKFHMADHYQAHTEPVHFLQYSKLILQSNKSDGLHKLMSYADCSKCLLYIVPTAIFFAYLDYYV